MITKEEKVFRGKVTNLENKNKCLVATLTNETKRNKIQKEFRFFDLLKYTNYLKIGDIANISYTENKRRGQTFNKATYYEVLKSDINHEFIAGTITNLNNSRARLKDKDDIAFVIKEITSKKVSYCYINKALTESIWFKKNQQVKLEIIPMQGDTHTSYRVFSLWGM